MSEIKVLVVDDHDLFRSGLSSLLAAEPDIEVVAQTSGGRAGVRLAHDLQPDVVLMDVRMPDLPAPEAMREILSDRPSTRVVVLAARSGEEDAEEVVHAGACGFLDKETPIEEVVTAVRAAAQGAPWLSPRAAEEVLECVRQADHERESDPRPAEKLSVREREVLQLIARGLDNPQIATKLHISPRTAKNFVASILRKVFRRWSRPGDGPEG